MWWGWYFYSDWNDGRMAHTGKFVIRTYHRIPIRCEVYYMGGDFLGKGTVMNLCRKGFRVLGDHQVVPGMELVVRLSLPDQDAPVEIQRVVVRWVRGLLFGAKVVTMSPDGEDRVGTFLSARLRAYCASS
jgi:ribosomal protein S14